MAEGQGVVQGSRAGEPRPISSSDDSGTERLAVDAKVSGTSEINLDAANDEVTVYGSSDGGTTRIVVKTDAAGRVTTDSTLQVADTDVSNANPVPVSDAGTTLSVDDGAGSLTVDNAALSVVGAGAEATAQRVTLSTESLAALESVTVQNPSGASAVNIQDGGNSITVDGTVSVSGPVDTELPAAAALADATANPTIPSVGAETLVFNGTTWDRQRGSTTGTQTIGGLAHDAVDTTANNPQKIGARAVAHGSSPTAVAAADVTHLIANRHGVPFWIGGHPNVVTVRDQVTDAEGAQTNVALVTVAGGSKIVVTQIMVTVDADCTVSPSFVIGFGAASTPTTTGVLAAHSGIPAGAGFQRGDGSGILGVGADGEDLRFTCDDPTGGNLDVTVSYYTIES